MSAGETFQKFKEFIDICYHRRYKGLSYDEVLSIFFSNFSGKEFLEFRKAQTKKK